MALNASGFVDPNGHGNGGETVGLSISNWERKSGAINDGYWFQVGFDEDNYLRLGTKLDTSLLRDAIEFKPALIIDGEKKVEGSSGWGIQPRSALGQTEDKEVLLLAIDGRKVGYSVGATVGDCADILLRYGATQAINLDGGSSTAFVYNGKTINRPSSSGNTPDGRYVPNAWIVERVESLEDEHE